MYLSKWNTTDILVKLGLSWYIKAKRIVIEEGAAFNGSGCGILVLRQQLLMDSMLNMERAHLFSKELLQDSKSELLLKSNE